MPGPGKIDKLGFESYREEMSTEELQEMLGKLLESQSETERLFRESKAENDRFFRESKAENDRQLRESKAENDRINRETNRKIKELGKQIGGLGNKFGTFTEGFVEHAVKKILREDFGMEFVGWGSFRKKEDGGRKFEEYDMYGYTNGDLNRGVLVEMKSKLTLEAVEQMKAKMETLFDWMPEHRNKVFEGFITYVHLDRKYADEIIAAIRNEGWHLAHVGEDVLEMIEPPEGFQPHEYRYEG